MVPRDKVYHKREKPSRALALALALLALAALLNCGATIYVGGQPLEDGIADPTPTPFPEGHREALEAQEAHDAGDARPNFPASPVKP